MFRSRQWRNTRCSEYFLKVKAQDGIALVEIEFMGFAVLDIGV